MTYQEKLEKLKEAYIDVLLSKVKDENVDLMTINDGIRMLAYFDKLTKSHS